MSPVLANRLLSSLSNKLKLFLSHSETPCTMGQDIDVALKALRFEPLKLPEIVLCFLTCMTQTHEACILIISLNVYLPIKT